MKLRPAEMIPQTAPVVVVDGTAFLGLAASLLLLRLHLLLLDHLRLEGQWLSEAVEFLPGRKNQGQYNSQSLETTEGPLTKNNPHVLRSGWPCGSHPQSRSRAGREMGLPVGVLLLMETLLGPHVAVATPSPLQKRRSGHTTHAHVVPPLLWG